MGEKWGKMGKKWVRNEITGVQKTVLMHASARLNGRRTVWVVGLWDHLVECAGGDAELDRARPPADVAGRAAAEGLGVVPQPHPFCKLRYRILRHKRILWQQALSATKSRTKR